MNLMEALISAKLGGSGGGSGDVTAAAVASAIHEMNAMQKNGVRSDIGAEQEKLAVSITKTGNQYSADKTYAEITAAVAAGKIVTGSYAGTDVFLASAKNSQDIQFFSLVPKSGLNLAEGFTLTLYALASNEAMTVANIDYPPSAVDADSVAAAISSFSAAQAAQALSDLGGEPAPTVTTVSGTTPTITPAANTIYNCGTLTSLTISNPPATGKYAIIFYSGATATTTVGIENFVAEANKRYKITVEDNYATYDSWPYTPT